MRESVLNIKVSVILPIYNGEDTLIETLESLVSQTFQNFELIACIDGTKDNSEFILEKYRSKFSKLIVLKNELNRGLGPTMNRLVANSSGEYIAVAEQDDFYYYDRLELQVKLLDERVDVGLVSGIAEFWDGEKVTMKFPGILVHGGQYPVGIDMFLLNYRKHLKVVNSCMMFRKSVHIANGLYFTKHLPNIGIDLTYILRFCLISEIYGLNKVLVRLDRRPNRDSITTYQENSFLGTRELIRSFAFEYKEIIDKKDYKYSMRTQYEKEMNSKSRLEYVLTFFRNILICPIEKRYYQSFNKRVLRKIKIINI